MKRLFSQCLDVALSEKIGVSIGNEKSKVRPLPTCHVENTLSCFVVASHGVGFEIIKKLRDNVEVISLDGPTVQSTYSVSISVHVCKCMWICVLQSCRLANKVRSVVCLSTASIVIKTCYLCVFEYTMPGPKPGKVALLYPQCTLCTLCIVIAYIMQGTILTDCSFISEIFITC